tara:strand:+ start:499 stop:936 length:438 start_codon:yes stop_codon:yes gene_type:complete
LKKLLLILLCLPLLFSTCKKEEEEEPTNNNTNITVQNIVGVWNINSLVYDDIDYTTVPGFESAAFIINSDNTFSQNVIFNGDLDIDYGNWDLSGSDLILYYDTEEEIRWSIDSFNSSTAFLTLVHYLNDDGNDEYTSGSATIVKQ